MANMSYCRFKNTLMDVYDCLEALKNEEIESISEKEKAKQLFIEILEFCQEEDIIEEFDAKFIDRIINNCK